MRGKSVGIGHDVLLRQMIQSCSKLKKGHESLAWDKCSDFLSGVLRRDECLRDIRVSTVEKLAQVIVWADCLAHEDTGKIPSEMADDMLLQYLERIYLRKRFGSVLRSWKKLAMTFVLGTHSYANGYGGVPVGEKSTKFVLAQVQDLVPYKVKGERVLDRKAKLV